MKLSTILAIIVLVGCAAGSTVYVTKESIVRSDIDEKIMELRAEQQKLEELRKQIDREVKEISNRQEKVVVPTAPRMPLPAPSVRPQTQWGGNVEIYEPTGSGSRPARTTPSLPKSEPPIIQQTPKTKPSPDLVSISNQLHKANAVFALPLQANIQEDIKAQLIIDPTKTLEELKKDVTAGPVQFATTTHISRIMIAKLEAPDFTITSSASQEQAVSDNSKTEWIWSLRPKSAGLHPVTVTLEAEVTVGNKTTKHYIRQFDRQVMIEITEVQMISQWWNKYWQWLFATLLIPLGKWGWDQWTSKKTKKRK